MSFTGIAALTVVLQCIYIWGGIHWSVVHLLLLGGANYVHWLVQWLRLLKQRLTKSLTKQCGSKSLIKWQKTLWTVTVPLNQSLSNRVWISKISGPDCLYDFYPPIFRKLHLIRFSMQISSSLGLIIHYSISTLFTKPWIKFHQNQLNF